MRRAEPELQVIDTCCESQQEVMLLLKQKSGAKMAMGEILPLIPPLTVIMLGRELNQEDWHHAVRGRTYLEHGGFILRYALNANTHSICPGTMRLINWYKIPQIRLLSPLYFPRIPKRYKHQKKKTSIIIA